MSKLRGPEIWPKKEKKMNKTKNMTKTIVGSALLIALTVVFTFISNNVQIVPGVGINLSLITIALAGILYGWKSGLLVGLVNGAIVMIGAAFFFAANPYATPFICLLKSGLAGLISALLFAVISKKNVHVAVFVSCIVVPLINTGIFMGASYLFFPKEFFLAYCIPSIWNFLLEIGISIILSPSVYYIIKVVEKRYEK